MKKHIFISTLALTLFSFLSCKTPTKTSSSNATIEQAMVKALAWQEANPIQAKAPTDWTNGAYYIGVVQAHKATKNKTFLDALTSMADRNKWQPWERFYHADDLAICNPYLYLNAISAKNVNLKPTDDIIKDHLDKPHAWRDGKGNKEQVMLWWWCDALFMTPPVLSMYAKQNTDPTYLDEMHKYYMQTVGLLYNKEEKLFARDNRFLWTGAISDLKEPNGKRIFWSRGNGWVIAGLALLLEDMPANYKHRPFYENLFKDMANRMKDLQPEDGLWRTSLLAPEAFNHGEVSGSGFHTFALAWGINKGLLDKKVYKPVVIKAWNAIAACQQENGKVGWVQGIGAEPKPATKDSWQNFGTGAFLMAGSEIMKLK